jgi:uncharacterized protein YbaP (TraB family)
MFAPIRKLAPVASALALLLAGCAETSVSPRSAPPAAVDPSGPALWKVADEDTTIYLFGTVHALPKDVEWYRGPVADALAASQVLVTEIPAGELTTPAVQQLFLARAQLPAGQSLRAMLSAEQRATFEAALTKFGLPLAALDKVEPWFAAMTLSALPLLKGGYSMEAGVESAIEGKLGAGKSRAALETVDGQLRLFDEMPMPVQIAYLVSVAEKLDGVVPSMNGMVAAWARGDAEELAKLMNDEIDDPALAERLLYARNRDWAQWVQKRLDEPGTVFVAVGAGHLAGAKSVQDYLEDGGTAVVRVQ